jgi:hypothetical protein
VFISHHSHACYVSHKSNIQYDKSK